MNPFWIAAGKHKPLGAFDKLHHHHPAAVGNQQPADVGRVELAALRIKEMDTGQMGLPPTQSQQPSHTAHVGRDQTHPRMRPVQSVGQ